MKKITSDKPTMSMVEIIIWLDEDGRKLGDLWLSTNEIIEMAKTHGYTYNEQSSTFSLT